MDSISIFTLSNTVGIIPSSVILSSFVTMIGSITDTLKNRKQIAYSFSIFTLIFYFILESDGFKNASNIMINDIINTYTKFINLIQSTSQKLSDEFYIELRKIEPVNEDPIA